MDDCKYDGYSIDPFLPSQEHRTNFLCRLRKYPARCDDPFRSWIVKYKYRGLSTRTSQQDIDSQVMDQSCNSMPWILPYGCRGFLKPDHAEWIWIYTNQRKFCRGCMPIWKFATWMPRGYLLQGESGGCYDMEIRWMRLIDWLGFVFCCVVW